MISYIPSFIPNKILIVGGGGTGSRLVPLLAQFLKTCLWVPNPQITVVDDDIVEEKNLLRQNFITPDVGKFKAEVLAQRYSRAFDIPVIPKVLRVTPIPSHNHYGDIDSPVDFEKEQEIDEIFQTHQANSIIVLCVDSPEARRHILKRIMVQMGGRFGGNSTILLLDSGNENDFGQITVSNAVTAALGTYRDYLRGLPNGVPVDMTLPYIPTDFSYFSGMKAETTASCADLDQTMAINTMMAVTMFGVIQNFYYAKPINFHRLNVTLSNGVTPEYISPAYLYRTSDRVRLESNLYGGTNMEAYAVSMVSAVEEFVVQYKNFKKMTDAAEAEMKRQAEVEAEAARKLIGEEAVRKAMEENGWKPKARKSIAATPETESVAEGPKPKKKSKASTSALGDIPSLTKEEIERMAADFLNLVENEL